VKPQAPAAQVARPCAGTVQRVPQALQLFGSLVVSVQALPHIVKPDAQVKAHWLPLQTAVPWAGLGQTLPHMPQLSAEVVTSTQARSQSMKPGVHAGAHPVLAHTWSAVHVLPHPPQLFGSLEVATQAPLHGT
jgi:hypothetical protein